MCVAKWVIERREEEKEKEETKQNTQVDKRWTKKKNHIYISRIVVKYTPNKLTCI